MAAPGNGSRKDVEVDKTLLNAMFPRVKDLQATLRANGLLVVAEAFVDRALEHEAAGQAAAAKSPEGGKGRRKEDEDKKKLEAELKGLNEENYRLGWNMVKLREFLVKMEQVLEQPSPPEMGTKRKGSHLQEVVNRVEELVKKEKEMEELMVKQGEELEEFKEETERLKTLVRKIVGELEWGSAEDEAHALEKLFIDENLRLRQEVMGIRNRAATPSGSGDSGAAGGAASEAAVVRLGVPEVRLSASGQQQNGAAARGASSPQ